MSKKFRSYPIHEPGFLDFAWSDAKSNPDKFMTAIWSHYPVIFKAWVEKNRPFVNIYSSFEKCLLGTKLGDIDTSKIPTSVLNTLQVIELRFETRRPWLLFLLSDSSKASGVIAYPFHPSVEGQLYDFDDPDNQFVWCYIGTDVNSGQTIMEMCDADLKGEIGHLCDSTRFESAAKFQSGQALKIAIGLRLLAADSEYFQPAILNSDQSKIGDVDMAILVDRAKRRGKFGFELGKGCELSPHFRNPHFAIRWTGKGGSVPRLVPVKGAIIHKNKALEIPTGFDGPVAV